MNDGAELFGWLIVLVLAVGYFSFVSHIGAANNGQHTGYVTAVEQEGIIWKTWRAYVKTDPQSSQEDVYCVKDAQVVYDLKSTEESRALVTVSYASPLVVFKWECGGESSIIQSISL